MLKFGVDLVTAIVEHRYIALLADEALDHFMVKHWPDEALFAAFVTNLLARAGANGRRVRAFGEMVVSMWARGDVEATLRLEYLWEQLCKANEFSLFCTYPKAGFPEDSSASVRETCQAHFKAV